MLHLYLLGPEAQMPPPLPKNHPPKMSAALSKDENEYIEPQLAFDAVFDDCALHSKVSAISVSELFPFSSTTDIAKFNFQMYLPLTSLSQLNINLFTNRRTKDSVSRKLSTLPFLTFAMASVDLTDRSRGRGRPVVARRQSTGT